MAPEAVTPRVVMRERIELGTSRSRGDALLSQSHPARFVDEEMVLVSRAVALAAALSSAERAVALVERR